MLYIRKEELTIEIYIAFHMWKRWVYLNYKKARLLMEKWENVLYFYKALLYLTNPKR